MHTPPRIAIVIFLLDCIYSAATGTGALAQSVQPVNANAEGRPESQWVHYDQLGQLVYKQTPQGDTIMDFSAAGYEGGLLPIPYIGAVQRVKPSGGDDTANIQNAVDAVEKLPLRADFRGAVELAPGDYNVGAAINITASGVVLRGSGSGPGGTVIHMAPPPASVAAGALPIPNQIPTVYFLNASGTETGLAATTPYAAITDSYVPSGAKSFHVATPSQFTVGQEVFIKRVITQNWIDLLGMNLLYDGIAPNDPESWMQPGYSMLSPRTIANIDGDTITLDAPLSDSIDARYVNGEVYGYTWPGRLEHVGLEHLRLISPPQTPCFQNVNPINGTVLMSDVKDAWVRDVVTQDVLNGVNIGPLAQKVTVAQISNTHTTTTSGNGLYFDFIIAGTQVLMDHLYSRGDHIFYFVTQSAQDGAQGPNVVHNADFEPANADGSPTVPNLPQSSCPSGPTTDSAVEPHQRWATGLLFDNVNVPYRAISLLNRGNDGSQGWAVGWGVAWNSSAAKLDIQQPPGAANFCIGCKGAITDPAVTLSTGVSVIEPEGIYDSLGAPVYPNSLYEAQRNQRLRTLGASPASLP